MMNKLLPLFFLVLQPSGAQVFSCSPTLRLSGLLRTCPSGHDSKSVTLAVAMAQRSVQVCCKFAADALSRDCACC